MRFLPFSSLAVAVLLAASVGRADESVTLIYSAPVPGAVSSATSIASGMAPTTALETGVQPGGSKTTNGPAWARFASGKGTLGFVGAGTLLPLTEGGRDGEQNALRVADSLLTSALVTEALKSLTHQKRPDGSDFKSFPSGHATAAFAVARMQAHFHPNQALLWYAGATVIAASRVKLRRHHVRDVVAGAAVGVLTSEVEIRQKRGLLLFPFINGSRQSKVAGLSFGGSF